MGKQLLTVCPPPLSEIWHPAHKYVSTDITFHILFAHLTFNLHINCHTYFILTRYLTWKVHNNSFSENMRELARNSTFQYLQLDAT